MSDDEEENKKMRNNRASVASIGSVGSEWYDTNGSEADEEGAPITSQLSLELRNDVIQESPNGAADGVSLARDLAAPNFSMTKLTTSALKNHSKVANNFENDLDVRASSGRFSGSMTVTGAKTPSTSNRDSNGKVTPQLPLQHEGSQPHSGCMIVMCCQPLGTLSSSQCQPHNYIVP